ncbi:hypothetical protein BS082_10115 [Enterococcus faecium]|nr:hypothetical protein BS082_10115 [Enterococcus faecium]
MKNNFPTFFIQEHPLFFSFSLFNWYLFLAPTLHQSTICLKLSNDYLPLNKYLLLFNHSNMFFVIRIKWVCQLNCGS